MFEKVNPAHPDKIADRIAGAIVDLAYKIEENPKIAVEVLLGHKNCHIIIESSINFNDCDLKTEIQDIVDRIMGINSNLTILATKQDENLQDNQSDKIRCGDNGIFKGMPTTREQETLSEIARALYRRYKSDGKYIISKDELIVCQSNATSKDISNFLGSNRSLTVNPIGEWTGGTDVDSGATNRKLGSDMGDAVTGGGLHGKDLSKADVSVNIYAHMKAQILDKPVELFCAIGDNYVDGKPYGKIVEIAKRYIKSVGGFEKFAEWGLI